MILRITNGLSIKSNFRWFRVLFVSLSLLASNACSDASTPDATDIAFENAEKPTPPSTIPELIEALSDSNYQVRYGAVIALGKMGTEAIPTIPALTENLYYDGSYELRQATASVLGNLGMEAESAVPDLIYVLETDFVHTRRAAAKALGQIGDLSAVPPLARALYETDRYKDASIEAAKAIGVLTGQEFPDLNSTGYSLDENGVPLIVIAAREWWEQEGQYQEWPAVDG